MTDELNSHEGPRPGRVVVLLVVIAIVAGVLGGWTIYRTEYGEQPSETVTPTLQSPPPTMGQPPTSQYVDLFAGLYTPDSFTARKVVDGVAIFDLTYDSWTIDHYRRTTSVMRAVDTATGAVLWTMSTTPDNTLVSFIYEVFYEDGKLLMSIEAPSETISCDSSATFILVLDIQTGEILSSRSYVDDCEPTASISAYHEGIVVIEEYGAITGYRDTDLDSIVWQDHWDPHGTPIFDQSSDWSVSANDTWFLTRDGRYVSADDGRVSTGSPGPWTDGQGPLLFDESGAIVTMLPTGYARYHELVRWSDMDLTDRLWEYEPPSGWALQDIGCSSSQVLALDLIPGDDINATSRTMSVVDAQNGQELWSISFNQSPVGWNPLLCTFTKDNHLLYMTGTTAIVADPTTGTLGSRTYGLFDGGSYSSIYPCGEWMCTTNFTHDEQFGYVATVTAVDVRSDPVEVQWRTQLATRTPLWFSYVANDHITYIGKDVNGTYRILVV